MTLDQMQGSIEMPAGFLVHRYPVDSGFGKCGNEVVRILNHQVAVQRQLGNLPQRLHHRRPDREVGNEVPIHNIDMDDAGSASAGGDHLLAQPRKISRKNRRSQFDQNPGASKTAFLLLISCGNFITQAWGNTPGPEFIAGR